MTKKDPWFLEERAVRFVSLVLTQHNEASIQAYAGTDMAIDLLVEVLKKGKSTLRFFGVQLVNYLDLPDIQNDNVPVLSHSGRDAFEAMLPICVFVIGVRKPEGIYTWNVEPVVEDGRALLHRDVPASWQPLGEAGISRLFSQVNAWYDAHNGDSSPKSRRRHSEPKTQ